MEILSNPIGVLTGLLVIFSALAAAVGAQFCHKMDAHPLKVTTGRLQFGSCNNFFSASAFVSAIFEVVEIIIIIIKQIITKHIQCLTKAQLKGCIQMHPEKFINRTLRGKILDELIMNDVVAHLLSK